MNISELREWTRNKAELELQALDFVDGYMMNVDFVAGNKVFLGIGTYDEMLSIIKDMKCHDEKVDLDSYYASDDDTLCVKYNVRKCLIIFFVNDLEKSTERISNGKCKVIIKTTGKTTREVECQLEGAE